MGTSSVFALGKGAVESIWGVARDPKADVYGRTTALDGLLMLGLADEEVRRDLRDRFRGLARAVLEGAPAAESDEAFLLSTLLVRVERKIGRNDPCPCGSGNKHKKCCRSG